MTIDKICSGWANRNLVWYKQATYPVLLISERGDGWGYFPGTAIGEFVIDAKHVINFIKNMFSKMVY